MSKIKIFLVSVLSLGILVIAQPALAVFPGSSPGSTGTGNGLGTSSSTSSSSSSSSTSSSSSGTKLDPCAKIDTSKQASATPTCSECHPGNSSNPPSLCVCHPEYYYGSALGADQYSSCAACNSQSSDNSCLTNNSADKALNTVVNVLAGIAALVVIGNIIVGGIQYSLAGNPQQTVNARKRIINALIALFAFLFIYAFLQWLIPGGL